MTRIEFTVKGELPPKKDGAKSMWDKPTEARRLVALRMSALAAMGELIPFQKNIRLVLEIYIGPENSRTVGDLDNFVTGVCDGLMAAHPRAKLDELWAQPDLHSIQPSRVMAIMDDSEVIDISARKVIGSTHQPWYRVALEGEQAL